MRKKSERDWLLIVPYVILSIVGVLMVFSASSFRLFSQGYSTTYLLRRQLIFMCLSWVLLPIICRVKKEVLLGRRLAYIVICLGILFLIMTRIGFFGVDVGGAQRWIVIFGIQFQPSELVNVAMILYLAYFFRYQRTWAEMKQPLILSLAASLLILFQPKVAGALLILCLAIIIITTSQVPVKYTIALFGVFFLGIVLLGGLILFLGEKELLPQVFLHTYDRIKMIGNPFADPYGKGFQMSQSYYAMYNGGLWGLGLGKSITKKGYLPVAETDFIFSILIEELGLVVGIIILGLLFTIILRLFMHAATAKNQQIGLIFLGTGTLLLLQTSINIASITGLIPMTGVPLPFISYGGSSYLILSMALGLCLKFSVKEESL